MRILDWLWCKFNRICPIHLEEKVICEYGYYCLGCLRDKKTAKDARLKNISRNQTDRTEVVS